MAISGNVEMTNDSSSFEGYSHQDKYFKFETTKSVPGCYFKVVPKTKLTNPIVNIKGWGNNSVFVNMNGKPMNSNEYVTYIDSNGDLLLLVIGSYSESVRIEVSSRPIAASIVTSLDPKTPTSAWINVYPNPSDQDIVNISFDEVEKVELVVLSVTGIEILRQSFESDLYQLKTNSLPTGSYILQIRYNDSIVTRKIVTR